MSKIDTLLEIEGYESLEEALDILITDSVCPGICKNPGCDYTTSVESDCDAGWCEICDTQSVVSLMVLAGF